ncbi:hypothetical protein MMC13_003966 [Lambiella insularis]|nr:hypothetical protein [Lambiella insularis]
MSPSSLPSALRIAVLLRLMGLPDTISLVGEDGNIKSGGGEGYAGELIKRDVVSSFCGDGGGRRYKSGSEAHEQGRKLKGLYEYYETSSPKAGKAKKPFTRNQLVQLSQGVYQSGR